MYDGLYFIDGTATSGIDHPPWGGSFESIAARCEDDALCVLGMPERLVFAPHVYGPDASPVCDGVSRERTSRLLYKCSF